MSLLSERDLVWGGFNLDSPYAYNYGGAMTVINFDKFVCVVWCEISARIRI